MAEDGSKIVTLSCEGHHETLVGELWKFLRTEHMVDFYFEMGTGSGRSLRAHRVVLAAFLSLEKLGDAEGKAATVLRNDRDSGEQLDRLLEFLYNGRVSVPEEKLEKLLEIARMLDFQMLVDAVLPVLPSSRRRQQPMRRRSSRRRANFRSPQRLVSYDETSDRDDDSDGSWRKPRANKRTAVVSCDEAADSDRLFRPDAVKDDAPSGSPVLSSDSEGDDPETASIGLRDTVAADPASTAKTTTSTKNGTGRRRPIWKCSRCDYQSIRKALYQLHLAQHDPSIKTFKCDTCKKPFACEVSLKRHKCVQEGEAAVYECPHCNYKCHVESFYQLHQAKHDPTIEVFRCTSCPRKFLREESLLCHKCSPAYAEGPKTHQCAHCPYSTRDKYRYNIHLSKHDPNVTIIRCDDCRKAFFSQEALARHKQAHQSYRCPHCDHETSKSWRHYDHLFTMHGVNTKGEQLPKMKCPECDFICRTDGLLRNHFVSKHSGEKPFKCDQCDFTSSHKSAIPQHIKIVHRNIKPHLCETCGYRAASHSALSKHNLSHTGEKPFACKLCDKAYSDITALKRHVGHLHGKNEKPFVCHVCGYASNRRSNLNVHLRKVHKTPAESTPPYKYPPKSEYSLYSL